MAYVINAKTRIVQHVGPIKECAQYIRNSEDMFGGQFLIAETAEAMRTLTKNRR